MTLLNSEILLVANILTRVTKYKGNCNKTIIIIPGINYYYNNNYNNYSIIY